MSKTPRPLLAPFLLLVLRWLPLKCTPPPHSHLLPHSESGGGVLCIAVSQLVVGLTLLGIYEGYKAYYYNTYVDQESKEENLDKDESLRVSGYESPL